MKHTDLKEETIQVAQVNEEISSGKGSIIEDTPISISIPVPELKPLLKIGSGFKLSYVNAD